MGGQQRKPAEGRRCHFWVFPKALHNHALPVRQTPEQSRACAGWLTRRPVLAQPPTSGEGSPRSRAPVV